jgi:predicted DNA-binding protein with PD1-like motif
MTILIQRSERARHLMLKLSAGEIVPDGLTKTLRDEGVACGWIRGGGVLADVALRVYDPVIAALGAVRQLEGPVQALVVEGSIASASGDTSVSVRALLARESDFGLQTLSGEVENARVVELLLLVTALDDLSLQPGPADAATAWRGALEASEQAGAPPRQRPPQAQAHPIRAAIPARPPRRVADLDAPFPAVGDTVDHFAFGRCDVLKSDGDRLHLKVHRDGRIREIALGMLRVSHQTDEEDGRRRFKLERRM